MTDRQNTNPHSRILKRGALLAGAATLGIGLRGRPRRQRADARPPRLRPADPARRRVQTQCCRLLRRRRRPGEAGGRLRPVKTAKVAACRRGRRRRAACDGLPPRHASASSEQLRRPAAAAGVRQPRRRPRAAAWRQGSGFFISRTAMSSPTTTSSRTPSRSQLVTDDGRTLDAKVVGTDPRTDLALLKVKETGNYPFVQLADGSRASATGCWRSATRSASAAR